MREVFEIPIGDYMYRAEAVSLKVGLTVSLTVSGGKRETPFTDRLNLDKAKDRDRYAEAAGTPLADLLTVRETLLDALSGTAAEDVPEETIDPEAERRGLELLDAPELLERVVDVARGLGYTAPAGAADLLAILFLALVSRLLARPLNIVVGGPSSAGKSFVVSTVCRLFPADAVYILSGMSERVLAYTDADLRHRTLIVGEAAALSRDGVGASMLRAIAWEGHLVYETVEKTHKGLKPRRIEKPGPTGFITTTTRSVEPELATRTLEITVPDTPDATRIILHATAAQANGHAPEVPDLSGRIAAQRWLATSGQREASIPFAERLADLVPADRVRWRRDFTQLLTLVQAHAVLMQRQRDRDTDGRVLADERDYRAVYAIVAGVFQAIASGGVTPQVRETVEAVRELTPDPDNTVTGGQVAAHLKLDKSAVSRRIKRALAGGWLVNMEDKKGRPQRLRIGDPLPDDRPALPSPEDVFLDPPCNRATVQPKGEHPQGDAENPVASPVAGVEDVHPPVQPPFPNGDAENAGSVAWLHGCTEDSGDDADAAAIVRDWLATGLLASLPLPFAIASGVKLTTAEAVNRFVTTYLVDARIGGASGERATRHLAAFVDAARPFIEAAATIGGVR